MCLNIYLYVWVQNYASITGDTIPNNRYLATATAPYLTKNKEKRGHQGKDRRIDNFRKNSDTKIVV